MTATATWDVARMPDQTGRTIVVTGPTMGGLGHYTALELARRGARVVLAGRTPAKVDATVAAIREEVPDAELETLQVDLASLDSVRHAGAAAARFGAIDVLVNNAGVEHVLDFETTPIEALDQIVNTNLLSLVRLARLVSPSMVERRTGHIVNIASVAGLVPIPHNATYSASKHAVVGFSRALRIELADHDVGVSVVCPGTVSGGMYLKWDQKAPTAVGKPVSSQAVAKAVVDAVLRNRGEVVVVRGLGKIGDVFQAIAPELSAKIMRMTGVADYLRAQAKVNAERR